MVDEQSPIGNHDGDQLMVHHVKKNQESIFTMYFLQRDRNYVIMANHPCTKVCKQTLITSVNERELSFSV